MFIPDILTFSLFLQEYEPQLSIHLSAMYRHKLIRVLTTQALEMTL